LLYSKTFFANRVLVIVYGSPSLLKDVKIHLRFHYLEYFEDYDGKLRKVLCEKLLGTSAILPIAVIMKGSTLQLVVIGLPSEEFWNQILTRFSTSDKPFLAYSVMETALPWHCSSCPPEHIIEEIRDLSSEEVEFVLKLIGKK